MKYRNVNLNKKGELAKSTGKKHTSKQQTHKKQERLTRVIGQRTTLKKDPLSSPQIFVRSHVHWENNMARSKDKKKDAENGEGDGNKDDTINEEPTVDYEELVKRICVIAKPLAGRKLTKRLYKTVKKGKRGLFLLRYDREVTEFF